MLTCGGRLAVHTISSAMSSGVSGSRPSYTLSAAPRSPRKRVTLKSVSTMPGSMFDTRIGVSTSSLRSAEVNARTANLDAQYCQQQHTIEPPGYASRPAIEPRFMIWPEPRSLKRRTNSCVRWIRPRTLVSSITSTSSGEISPTRSTPSTRPALFTR